MLIKAKEGEKIAGTERKLIVHCWRGGMRSENMAWLFSRLGIDCYTLAGGYKTYRRYGRNLIQNPLNLIVLGGMTGSGKTEILNILEDRDEQVLNLEMKAHHKVSAFGSIGQEKQYETEHFENLIFEKVRQFDLSRPVWIEDESKHIGKNCIPDELFAQMRRSPVIKIIMPKKHRVKRLVDEYSEFGDEYLRYSILKIDKRLGGVKANQALGALEQKDYETVASIVLDYYDKAYNFGLSKRAESTIFQIELPEDTPRDNASKILAFAEKKLTGNIVF
jgi:tRNA 2-selenouridine synthase